MDWMEFAVAKELLNRRFSATKSKGHGTVPDVFSHYNHLQKNKWRPDLTVVKNMWSFVSRNGIRASKLEILFFI